MNSKKKVFNIGFILSIIIILIVSITIMVYGIEIDNLSILNPNLKILGFTTGFSLIALYFKKDTKPMDFIEITPDGELKTKIQIGFAMQIILIIATLLAIIFGILVIIRIFLEKKGLSFILSIIGLSLFVQTIVLLNIYPFKIVDQNVEQNEHMLYGVFSVIFTLASISCMSLSSIKKTR
ncbi:hypothetical protein [Mycoplasma elephantis]|uniref:hypothetical protein n=1 Tax=Mycoplasma elephantis TaxID=114882 RepID=UPI00047F5044|nr:hypothetical protein [Mycoplasma elephantis]